MIRVYDLPRVIRREQISAKFSSKGAILFLTEDRKNEDQYFIQGMLPYAEVDALQQSIDKFMELQKRGAVDVISHIAKVYPTASLTHKECVQILAISDFMKETSDETKKRNEDAEYQAYLSKKRHIEYMKRMERREMRDRENHVADLLDDVRDRMDIRSEIKKWLANNSYNDFLHAISNRVKGQVDLERFLANVYHYFTVIAAGGVPNNNVLLAAPSGCGKTETFRALRDYFKDHLPNLPIAQVDMTGITEEGFKGENTKDVVRCLAEKEQTKGVGIIFLDEFDKKLIPSYTSSGNNVNAAVQAQLLTLIEGRELAARSEIINTANTLFVGLGSFDTCRSKRSDVPKSLGFCAGEEQPVDHYEDISREDMIQLGASYELLGRFSMIVNYHKLNAQTIDSIIDENAKNIGKSIGYSVHITDEKRAELHAQANGKFGCRLLHSAILDGVMKVYPELLKGNCRKGYYTIVLGADSQVVLEKGWNRIAQ